MTYSEKVIQEIDEGNVAAIHENVTKALEEDSFEYLGALQEVLLDEGYIDEAKRIIEVLLEEHPDYDDLKLNLAEIEIEEDHIEEAFALLDQIPASSEYYVPALLLYADLYQMIGFSEVSEKKLLEAKTKQSDPIIDLALAELYYDAQRYPEALAAYQAVYKEVQTPQLAHVSLLARIGEVEFNLGHLEESIIHLEQALKNQEEWNTIELLAQAYMAKHEEGKAKVCLEYLEENGGASALSLGLLAQLQLQEGEAETAFEKVKAALDLDPLNISLYFLAANIAFRLQNVFEAEAYLKKALEVSDYETSDTSALALASLYVHEQRMEEALTVLASLEEIDGFAHWLYAQAYATLENYNKAREHYQQAAEDLGHNSDFLRDYGLFLREEGDIKAALACLTHYLEHEPADVEIADLVQAELEVEDAY